jgi:acetoin utilization protein AcuB
MSRNLLTLKQSASINEAITLFNEHSISCIPIIDSAGKAIGIVSWRDILKNLAYI